MCKPHLRNLAAKRWMPFLSMASRPPATRSKTAPFLEAGGKGLFTKELDEALLDGRIDAAVHSMKDLPTELPAGLALVCVPDREDVRDALISDQAKTITELPKGALVGTASLRRQAQLLKLRPDVKIEVLRGNVRTRIDRVRSGSFAATFLALAGLKRLGFEGEAASILSVDEMLPAAGQGALAIVCRGGDASVLAAFAPLNKPDHHVAVTAERAFLAGLDGSCRTPIAAHGQIQGTRLTLVGEVLTPDGAQHWREADETEAGPDALADAARLGANLATRIRARAGEALAQIVQ